jgi:hypothetical protein
MGYVGIGFCLTPIHVSERLAVSIEHLVATWNLLNGPWCWEAFRHVRVIFGCFELSWFRTMLMKEEGHGRDKCAVTFREDNDEIIWTEAQGNIRSRRGTFVS